MELNPINSTTALQLPQDVVRVIFSFLELKEIAALSEVCKFFNTVLKDDRVWHDICNKSFRNEELKDKKPLETWQKLYLKLKKQDWARLINNPPKKTVFKGHTSIQVIDVIRGKLVTQEFGKEIRIWDLHKGSCLKKLSSSFCLIQQQSEWQINFSDNQSGHIALSDFDQIELLDLDNFTSMKIKEANPNEVGKNRPDFDWWHDTFQYACDLKNDRKTIFYYTIENTVFSYDVKNQNTSLTFLGHTKKITCFYAVYSDESYLVTGSKDHTLKIWNTSTGACTHTLEGHKKEITSLCAMNACILSGSSDGTIRKWSKKVDWECVDIFKSNDMSYIHGLKVRGDVLFSTGIGLNRRVGNLVNIKVWNWVTGQCLKTFSDQVSPDPFRFQVCGSKMIVIPDGKDNRIEVWDFDPSKSR